MEIGETCRIPKQSTITCARCNVTEPVDIITGKSMHGPWYEIKVTTNSSLYLCRKCNKTYEKRVEKMRVDILKDLVGEEKFAKRRNISKEESDSSSWDNVKSDPFVGEGW